jgi:hypothetical protein
VVLYDGNEWDGNPTSVGYHRRSRLITFRAADGVQSLKSMRWRGWGKRRVVGRGTGEWCPADGSPCQAWPVTVVLDRLGWRSLETSEGWRQYQRIYRRARCSFPSDAPRKCIMRVRRTRNIPPPGR